MTEEFESKLSHEEIEREAARILLEENNKEISSAREYIDARELDRWNNKGYNIELSDDSGNYSIVMIGESHLDEEQWQKQIELVRLIKPEYVLHEWLGGLVYNPETEKFEGDDYGKEDYVTDVMKKNNPDIGAHGLPAQLYSLSKELGFKIVGCDLTKSEMARVEDSFGEEEAGIKKEGLYLPGTGKNIMRVRDMEMADTMLKCQGESNKPIVAIVGFEHGDSINSQHLLQEKGAFGYAYINQVQLKNKY